MRAKDLSGFGPVGTNGPKAAAPVGAVPQDLPPLPDAELDCHGATTVYSGEYFTADQMRAYAEAALASQAARMGDLEQDAARLDWLAADMERGADGVGIYFDDDKFRFPYLVSNAGGFGGGVGEYFGGTLREAIDAAIDNLRGEAG